MKIVGITGGLCTGTSTVIKYIEEKGFPVITKKEIFAHLKGSAPFQNVSNLYLELANKESPLKDAAECALVEYIKKRETFYKLSCKEVLFVDVPFLYECALDRHFSKVIVVTCGPKTQEDRAEQKYLANKSKSKTKPYLHKKDIHEILANQIPIAEKRKKCNFVIDNNKSIELTYSQIDIVLNTYHKYSIFYILMVTIGVLSIVLPLAIKYQTIIPAHEINEKLKKIIDRLRTTYRKMK